jgi:hypothetical protein
MKDKTQTGGTQMKFNRADFKDVIRVAKQTATNWNKQMFVYASRVGYRIEKEQPSFSQDFIKVTPSEAIEYSYDFQKGQYSKKVLA